MPESDQSNTKAPTPSKVQKKEPVEKDIDEVTDAPKISRTRNGDNRRRGPSRGDNKQQEEVESPTTRRPTDRRGSNRATQKSPIASRHVPTPAPVKNRDAWEIPPIQCNEPEDGVFYAQMGPTGGKRGYPAITGEIISFKKIELPS